MAVTSIESHVVDRQIELAMRGRLAQGDAHQVVRVRAFPV